MKKLALILWSLAGIALADSAPPVHFEGGVLADKAGMTVYVFDNDRDGVPSCYGGCAVVWPPVILAAGESLGEKMSVVPRTDGSKQVAFNGRPLYLYAGDEAPGDKKGDGISGVWHLVTESPQ